MSPADINAVVLTLQLALTTTFVLFVIGTPVAWWLATTHRVFKPAIEAITALPLVLPPTVLGFYLLILLSPQSSLGSFIVEITGVRLIFSFTGLVFASVIYSLPFMVQPLQVAFERVQPHSLEDAYMLGARKIRALLFVIFPQCKRGFVTAAVLTFAHTVGEFGVVLMIGGNIPGETRVISIAIYEHVETIAYADAHVLAAFLLVFSFLTLLGVFALNRHLPLRTH
ncbi:MAG: molybdate ABC transporter permease subunit [Gammaproteobacteria bacterium]|nr:molybdate ABC transporter permease subunit [Gammaproteobacteria bacterium]